MTRSTVKYTPDLVWCTVGLHQCKVRPPILANCNTEIYISVGPLALRVAYTDASNTGYAGYTVQHGCHIAHGLWLPEEAVKSSTWQEIQAICMVLEALKSKLSNERVQWFTDNQNVASVGSRKPDLQAEEALAVFFDFPVPLFAYRAR